jgi:hypothetical protein
MTTYTHPRSALSSHVSRQAAWFVFGSAAAFAIPYVGISVLDLQPDAYYAAYFAITLALLAAYVRSEQIDARGLFTRNWLGSVVVGVPIGAFVVWNVLRSDATPRPHGAHFVFELLWRGAGYGVIDTLLLTAFPCVVAYSLLHGHIHGVAPRLRFVALALPLVMVITATYHLGYPQFRADGVAKPETGNVALSIPTLATMNPIGSIAAHASMHITAVIHAYETPTFLPPQTTT